MPRRYPRDYPRVEDDDFDWRSYISVGERRDQARREAAKLKENSPIVIEGSRIANTFWGKSWCQNLERYSDYANRLPRGRTYVRSGCVIDLKITPGVVAALVSGSRVYDVEVRIAAASKKKWAGLCQNIAGAIDSLVELVKGNFPKPVMDALCRQESGLFPSPSEIRFTCSCPDSARMCKHISAVLYGVGARLDEDPELLFLLRNVNQKDLISKAGTMITKSRPSKILNSGNLSEIFGIEIVEARQKPKPSRKKRP